MMLSIIWFCRQKRVHKTAVFSKTKHFRAMVSIDDHGTPTWAFQRTHS